MKIILLLLFVFTYEAHGVVTFVPPKCSAPSKSIACIMEDAKLKSSFLAIPEFTISDYKPPVVPLIFINETMPPVSQVSYNYNATTKLGAPITFSGFIADFGNHKFQVCLRIPQVRISFSFKIDGILFGVKVNSPGYYDANYTDGYACSKGKLNIVKTPCGCFWQFSEPVTDLWVGGAKLSFIFDNDPKATKDVTDGINANFYKAFSGGKPLFHAFFNTMIIIPYSNSMLSTIPVSPKLCPKC